MVLRRREWDFSVPAQPRMQTGVVLAALALLYRISWPIINAYSAGTPQSATYYSLATKFIFVFMGLSCFVSLFPALNGHERLEKQDQANRFDYYTAVLISLAVTTINYAAGWRCALVAIDEYFTRGYLFEDPSLFDRVAVVLCSCVVSGLLLALAVWQWMRIGSCWREALREQWLQQTDLKDGRTTSPLMLEKAGF